MAGLIVAVSPCGRSGRRYALSVTGRAGGIPTVAAAHRRMSEGFRLLAAAPAGLGPVPRQGSTQMGTAATSGNLVGSITIERSVALE